jgi:GNAT superfamily N-acetyltransferase
VRQKVGGRFRKLLIQSTGELSVALNLQTRLVSPERAWAGPSLWQRRIKRSESIDCSSGDPRLFARLLKKAIASDEKTFIALLGEFAGMHGVSLGNKQRERLSQAILGRKPRLHIWIAWKGSDAVGIAVVIEGFSTFSALPSLNLEDLYVRPQFRRLGAGQALLSSIQEFGVSHAFGRLDLTCAGDPGVIGYYRRMGGRTTRRVCLRFPLSFEREEAR